jgi:hypothetical protein
VIASGRHLAWAALLAAAVVPCVVAGQTPTAASAVVARPAGATIDAPPAWSTLTPVQRSMLRPLQGEWPRLDDARKAKWLVLAGRLATMPEPDRQRIQQRMAEWARLSPAERGRARQNYLAFRELTGEDRQALWDAYQALPEEKRQELARRTGQNGKASPEPKAQVPSGKRNLVQPSSPPVTGKPVNPTVIQAKPGATTTLVTKKPAPPAHNQPGLPKIAAMSGFVDPSTMLPSRGPQGAAAAAPVASSASGAADK